MNSFNILSAIKVNAAALADTSYNEEAEPYIRTLSDLFDDFTETMRAEKTASDADTPKAAEKNNPIALSDKSDDLSSFHIGQRVHTPQGDGLVAGLHDGHLIAIPLYVIGHCEICGWPIYEGDIYEYTESGLRHCGCKQKEEGTK